MIPKLLIVSLLLFLAACQSDSKKEGSEETASTTAAVTDTLVKADPDIVATDDNASKEVAEMIRKTLTERVIKKDLSSIPANQRKFKYHAFDLDNDGKHEYLVACTGFYFCGTGGCSAYLLNQSGNLINNFTVVDFPIYVAASTTNGWQDLIMRSGGKFHYVKMKGGQYPMNPSVQPAFNGNPPSTAPKLLDVFEGSYPAFPF